jgi:hypothetical protein
MPVSSTELVEAQASVADVTPAVVPAEGEKSSMLDAVKAALAPKLEVSPTSEEAGKEKPEGEAAGDGDEGKPEFSEDELKQFSQRAQHRFRHLATENNRVKAEIEAIKPKAAKLDEILAHLNERGISHQEFDNAVGITALVKHDPAKALEVLTPIFQDCARRAGRVIPPNLAEQVRLGHLNEQHARELSEAKARAALLEEQAQQRQEQAEQRERERGLRERVNTATQAVDQWAKQKAGSDPDWHTKQTLVANEVELELHRVGAAGYPKNRAEAVALAEKALKTVDETLKPYRPQLKSISTVTGQGASAGAKAEPTSMLEAAKLGLAAMRAG